MARLLARGKRVGPAAAAVVSGPPSR